MTYHAPALTLVGSASTLVLNQSAFLAEKVDVGTRCRIEEVPQALFDGDEGSW
jgi:hypothetical protein